MLHLGKLLSEGEEGHATVAGGTLVGVVGAILLTIGAANDTDVLTIIGGIVLAVGLLAGSLLRHRDIDYGVYARLEKLEK